MAEWYYAQNDEQLGPVTATALKEMAQQGRLGRDDLIWREGMQRWAPAHKVRGLFPHEPEKSPAASPPAAPPMPESDASANGVADAPLVDDEETAIDALPLANQEESKLQLPILGTPEIAAAARGDSNELVVFEAVSPPPRAAESPAPKRAAEPVEERAPRASDSKQLRVDVPTPAKGRFSRSFALFTQTFLWVSCLLVIVGGGAIYIAALVMRRDAGDRLAASGVYATCVVAAYFLASSTQRLSHVLGQWFVADVQVKERRTVRERNWKRFQ